MERIVSFDTLRMTDVARVGGKNASLGEMIGELSAAGVRVPGGFATTSDAFREFLARDGLAERIRRRLANLDVADVRALAAAGDEIRGWIGATPLPGALERELRARYARMAAGGEDCAVAVRSSATAEDLPEASFAGQQETLLNVQGADAVVDAVREVFASLFNDRAIAYRAHQGFAHADIALSAGVQRMVRSDLGASGVAFTIDTESGFEDVVFITAAWGLGELVVQGQVNPDEFYVHKPSLAAGRPSILRRERGSKALKMVCHEDPAERVAVVDVTLDDRRRFSLSDDEVIALARDAVAIERHYGRAMDIEWARDGVDGRICILQARPETVQSRRTGQAVERFELKERGEVLAEGRSIGQRIGAGAARLVLSAAEMDKVRDGDVLVTDMTDPDWEPVMKRTAAIVTNRGGRTCHAAIIARELGIPAVVGAGDATRTIGEGAEVTVSCAEGDTGYVYAGRLDFELRRLDVETMPCAPVQDRDERRQPGPGVRVPGPAQRRSGARAARVRHRQLDRSAPAGVARLRPAPRGVARARTRAGRGIRGSGVVLRREAGGGRGDDRGRVPSQARDRPALGLQVRRVRQPRRRGALRAGRGEPDARVPRGVTLPVGRLPPELRAGVPRDAPGCATRWASPTSSSWSRSCAHSTKPARWWGCSPAMVSNVAATVLRIVMMCEVPSNAILAEEFLEHFDGFSIGSNDLTQMTLGLDRNSGLMASRFDERDPAVKALLHRAIAACRKHGKYVGICGQGPSDHPDLAHWLMEEGIDSVSLNPDSVVETWLYLGGGSADRGAPARA